jgi:O-antigen/teichoic acid export membrane protein
LPQARSFNSIKPTFGGKRSWSLTKLALPLGVVMGLGSLQAGIPKYVIARHLGTDSLGYYAAVSYILMAGGMMILSVGQTAVPRLARFYVSDSAAFESLLVKMMLIALTAGLAALVLGFLFGKWFLALVYTPEYVRYFDVFMWLLAGALVLFLNSMLGYAMMAARIFKIQMLQSIVVTLTIAAACVFLVPRYELLGAAWAMLIAMILKFAIGSVVVCSALTKMTNTAALPNIRICLEPLDEKVESLSPVVCGRAKRLTARKIQNLGQMLQEDKIKRRLSQLGYLD